MIFLIIKCVLLFLIPLKLFIFNIDACNITDLKIICAPRWGREITPDPPAGCTALSLTSYDKILLESLNLAKGALPLMVNDNRNYIIKWTEIVKRPVTEYAQEFIDHEVSVIAIDMGYYAEDNYTNPELTKNLAKFFDDLKKEYPKMLFGLSLQSDENPIKNGIDFKVLNDHVHFYLLAALVTRNCHFESTPVYPIFKDVIVQSLTKLRDAKLDTDKLIFTIDLRIFTIKDDIPEDMAYSQVCSKKVSIKRKLCYQTIPDLFNKAQLRVNENLLGIYIDNSDYDDINASCNCPEPDGTRIPFKGISVIAGACCDKEAKLESFDCPFFPTITRP